jgi:4-hydroxy-3-methylbut-2-enyl diphosphate reductase
VRAVSDLLDVHGAPIYVRKQIVHNSHVVAELSARGAVFVDDLSDVPAGSKVVFSAHGVSPAVVQQARASNLEVVDATCPLVAKVHAEARRYAAAGDTILLIGHAEHEETVGTLGEAPDRIRIIEDANDAATIRVDDPTRVAVLTQTTLAVDETRSVMGILRRRFPELRTPDHDICYATTNRQLAVRAVAREADIVLVLGSPNSSNSARLAEVAKREGTPAWLIENATAIGADWLVDVERIGLSAGASAPSKLVTEVIDLLRSFGPLRVEERIVAVESVHFSAPHGVPTQESS